MREILTISPEVFAIVPGLQVIAVAADGLVARRGDEVEALWHSMWSRVHSRSGLGNPQSHPNIRHWRLAMKAAGAHHKRYPTSTEALLRRALKSPQVLRINPLVDFYNSVSLRYVVPVGAFDLAALAAPIELRVTRTRDTFQALDEVAPETVPAGELAYAVGSTVVTRHLVWRQSWLGLVTAATRSALFVSEILPEHLELAEVVRRDLCAGLKEFFSAEVHARVLSEEAPVLSRAAC